MIIKDVKYLLKYIDINEIDIPTFCKQCKITKDTFNKILEGKHISFISYYRICKKLNVSLKKLQIV